MAVQQLLLAAIVLGLLQTSCADGDLLHYVGRTRLPPLLFLSSFEGIAASNTRLYWSSEKVMAASDHNYDVTIQPLRAIPPPLRNDGFDHIGDIDHHNGLLYAPLERPSYINASFAVYNASTLQWTGRAALTPQQHMCVLSRMTSAPVPCVSEADSLLYSSEFDNVSSVYAYDLATLHQTAQVMLRGVVLMGVQGGAFQQDRLYLSCNDDFIYCFVPVAAASPVAFELEYRFSANFTGEMEGIAFADLRDQGQGTLQVLNGFHPLPKYTGHHLFHYDDRPN